MMTGEQAYETGLAIKNKTIDSVLKRGCPTLIDNALESLLHFGETDFQYKKDIQVEALLIGFTTLRDSEHVSQYKKIMERIKYGDNPEIKITGEQIAKKDRFEFSGSIIKHPVRFEINKKTSDSMYALAGKIDMDTNNFDFMAYAIGCQSMLSNISPELLNSRNKEIINNLTKECARIHRFLELRTLHKIVEHCPIKANYDEKVISWDL